MPMDIAKLTQDPQLLARIAEVRERIQTSEHAISDVVDGAGNQYVDLVMEGGGMLGIALVGYTWALEELGIRFLGIGGTSAGSINALLLAAMNDPAAKKSPQLLEAMGNLDFYRFVDGDGTDKGRARTRKLIERALDGEPVGVVKAAKLLWHYWRVREQLVKRYGLNSGDEFTTWLTGLLRSAGIEDSGALHARMQRIPALRLREGREPPPGWQPTPGRLVVIASDITTETRVEFPDMAELYWADADRVNPACFARASMSIPYFFETFRVRDLPDSPQVRARWAKVGVDLTKENGDKVPAHALFVDGGITSNFPIDAFHDISKVPTRPTFGVKLQYDDRYKPPAKLPLVGGGSRKPLLSLGGAMFNSARHTLDYEFIKRHPDYRHLVQFIPCTYEEQETDPQSGAMRTVTRSYNWLDFNMPMAQREGLFRQGAQQAIAFIERFSSPVDTRASGGQPADHYDSLWAYYKALRQSMLTPARLPKLAEPLP
jgi:NTE family protein